MKALSTRPEDTSSSNAYDAIAPIADTPSAILNVGPDETYATIVDALGVANTGDQIVLETGYGDESVLITVNNLFVDGDHSSKHIDLTLGLGVDVLTLQGNAPINVIDNGDNDTINGNMGANVIEVSGGIDVVHGGGGIDRLFVDYSSATGAIIGTAVNITDGGGHAVTFDGFENFTIYTGSGDDTLTVGDGTDIIHSGAGNDTITSGNGHNQITAGLGNDTVTAGDGGNRIWGELGNDTITSGTGNDYVNGGSGDDTVTGGGGNDTMIGGKGNDTISGGAGDDDLFGGPGVNTLDGGTGVDTADYSLNHVGVSVSLAIGVAQAVDAFETDTLTNIESLTGSDFHDTLTGNASNNVLTGGLGADHLNGGGGSDTFVYAAAGESTSSAFDVITGFDTLTDTFDISSTVNAIDATVASGLLTGGHFDADMAAAIGASQLGAHDAVLFTPTSGSFAGDTFLIVDVNGQAGYQAGEDFVMQLDASMHLESLNTGDFI